MVRINGKFLDVAGQTLLSFLEDNEYNIAKLAVEKNNEIIPKKTYADIVLSDGDKIEIVSFVGGG